MFTLGGFKNLLEQVDSSNEFNMLLGREVEGGKPVSHNFSESKVLFINTKPSPEFYDEVRMLLKGIVMSRTVDTMIQITTMWNHYMFDDMRHIADIGSGHSILVYGGMFKKCNNCLLSSINDTLSSMLSDKNFNWGEDRLFIMHEFGLMFEQSEKTYEWVRFNELLHKILEDDTKPVYFVFCERNLFTCFDESFIRKYPVLYLSSKDYVFKDLFRDVKGGMPQLKSGIEAIYKVGDNVTKLYALNNYSQSL